MSKKSFEDTCGVARTLAIVGERWTLVIIRELLVSKLRFQDMQERLPGLSASLLSDRLKSLEQNEIIFREYYSDHPPRAAYGLTPKGIELGLVVTALGRWGVRHLNAKMGKTTKHKRCNHTVEPNYYCSCCKKTVPARDVVIARRASTAP